MYAALFSTAVLRRVPFYIFNYTKNWYGAKRFDFSIFLPIVFKPRKLWLVGKQHINIKKYACCNFKTSVGNSLECSEKCQGTTRHTRIHNICTYN